MFPERKPFVLGIGYPQPNCATAKAIRHRPLRNISCVTHPLNPPSVRGRAGVYDVKTPYFPYYYIYVWHITRRTAANRSGPEMQKKFCISIKFYYIVGAKVPHSDSLQRYRATKGKPYTSHKTTKTGLHRPPCDRIAYGRDTKANETKNLPTDSDGCRAMAFSRHLQGFLQGNRKT